MRSIHNWQGGSKDSGQLLGYTSEDELRAL